MVRDLSYKVEAVNSIGVPTKVRYLCWFAGIVYCYRDMWSNRAHPQELLTKLFSTKFNFKLTCIEQNSFMVMKKIAGIDVLLSYPNFIEDFMIHMDAS